ncbi:MAG: hypothetical protein NTW86_05075, partial [Candidatus Sumerlaeota bacterium]|nr:hypothetical protein [Candidatus Sumerlaeota bacterium]
GFNPRYYFAHLVAALTKAAPLWAVCFSFLLLCTVSVSVVTALCARDWFGGSALAGMLACPAAVVLTPFFLGQDACFFTNSLLSSSPAFPLVLIGFWLSARGRFLRPALACGAAAMFHPLIGLECGALALAAAFVAQRASLRANGGNGRRVAGGLAAGAGILFAFALFWIVPEHFSPSYAQRVDSATFIETLAYFRAPHHYIPSAWPRSDYEDAALFTLAALLAWHTWRRAAPRGAKEPWGVLGLAGAALASLPLGYVFVERVPLRWAVIAQFFRLSNVIGWAGLVLLAGAAARRFETGRRDEGLLAMLGPLAPKAAFLGQGFLAMADTRFASRARFRQAATWIAIVAAVLAIQARTFRWEPVEAVALCWSGALLLLWMRSERAALAPPAIGLATLVFLLGAERTGHFPSLSRALDDIKPRVKMTSVIPRFGGMAEYAQAHTPPDALFLTPPLWGGFRLAARRAILVDWKSFCFQDRAMVEWRRRIEDAYGKPRGRTYVAGELDDNYRKMTDAHLRDLAVKYPIAYAVLFVDTPTSCTVVTVGHGYKLVQLDGAAG